MHRIGLEKRKRTGQVDFRARFPVPYISEYIWFFIFFYSVYEFRVCVFFVYFYSRKIRPTHRRSVNPSSRYYYYFRMSGTQRIILLGNLLFFLFVFYYSCVRDLMTPGTRNGF